MPKRGANSNKINRFIFIMLAATIKADPLTPNIKLSHAAFTQIEPESSKDAGYFAYQAESRTNGEIHHIRAFNINSASAQKSINQAISIFLQETLRLCSLHPTAILRDTLEFSNNKICYAIKPITARVTSSTPNINAASLLEGLITDLHSLSNYGRIQIPVSSIYQIEMLIDEENRVPGYFVQDWNRLIETMEIFKASGSDSPQKTRLDMSIQITETRQQNVYQLALSMLEVSGFKRQDLQQFLGSGAFLDGAIKLVFEHPKVGILNLTSETKELLASMLGQDVSKRPSFEEVLSKVKRVKYSPLSKTQSPKDNNMGIYEPIKSLVFNASDTSRYSVDIKALEDKNSSAGISLTRINTQHIDLLNRNEVTPRKDLKQSFTKPKIKFLEEGTDQGISRGSKDFEDLKVSGNSEEKVNYAKQLTDKKYMVLRRYLDDSDPLDIKLITLPEMDLGDEGVVALSENRSWINLTWLVLDLNDIGAEGAAALSQNRAWTRLTTIGLFNNKIGDKGAAALSKNTSWVCLTTLDLRNNNIGASGAAALGKNKSWTKLTSLDLLNNNIGDQGARALSENISWENLTVLNLTSNKISSEGAVALGKNLSWKKLETLDLFNNNIDDEGVIGLSRNIAWANLSTLYLVGGKVSGLGEKELKKRWPRISLI